MAQQTTTFSFSIPVGSQLAVHVPSPVPTLIPGQPYSLQLTATGGTPPYTWSVFGLPPGLTFSATTGLISGTTGPASAATFGISGSVTDSGV